MERGSKSLRKRVISTLMNMKTDVSSIDDVVDVIERRLDEIHKRIDALEERIKRLEDLIDKGG